MDSLVHKGSGGASAFTSPDNPLPVTSATGVGSVAFTSTALEGGRIVSAAPGTLVSLSARIDSTLASGTYYVQVHNAAAEPANGTSAFLLRPFKVVHVSGLDDDLSFDIPSKGVKANVGVYVCISSTEFTKTIVASSGSFEGMVA